MLTTPQNKQQQINFMAEMLFKKFQSIALTTPELATVIPRSEVSRRRDRGKKIGIPYTQFKKDSKGGRNLAMYNIYDIAEYMVDNTTKVS